jgi:DNA-binding beta-propeller fold protein YncE
MVARGPSFPSIRRLGLWLVAAALPLASWPAVAGAITLKITVQVNEKATQDGTFVKVGQSAPGNVFIFIRAEADGDCGTFIIQNGPSTTGPFQGQSLPTMSTKRIAYFQLKVQIDPPTRPHGAFRTEDFYAHATCGLSGNPNSPIEKAIINGDPAPDPIDGATPPDNDIPAANDAAQSAAKDAGTSTKTDGSAPFRRGAPASLGVPTRAANVFDAFAALGIMAAVPLAGTEILAAPTGPIGDHVSVGSPPPLPALPPELTGTGRADVEAALANLADQIAVGAAADEMLARRSVANATGDAAAHALQTADAAALLERWAGILGDAAALRQRAQTAIAAAYPLTAGSFVQADVDAINADARLGGTLPAGLQAALTQAGASADALWVATGRMGALRLSDVNGFVPTLVSPEQANAESHAALDLRHVAADLRAGGAGQTKPVAGPREPAGIGELRPVGCIAADPGQAAGCRKARGMEGAKYGAISPDGRFVYVGASGALAAFSRDLRTGALKQLAGVAGCLSASVAGCTKIPHSTLVADLVVSPDGRSVYADVFNGGVVAAFARNPKTGALRYVGCVGDPTDCTKGPGRSMGGVKTLAISPDGRNVYATSVNGVDVVELARNATTSRLAVVGCIGRADYGCDPARAIGGPGGVAVSADGAWVYESDSGDGAVSALRRDPISGRLTDAGCVAGRDGQSSIAGCANGLGLGGPEWVTAGPNGTVWVGSSSTSALVRLQRDDTGAIGMADVAGACTIDLAKPFGSGALCAGQPGLGSAYGVALSPDGTLAYVAGYAPGALSAFRVDAATGGLVGVGPCFGAAAPGCTEAPGMKHAGHDVLSPDGRHVLVLAPESNAISVYARHLTAARVLVPTKALKLHKGRVTFEATCPADAVAWCYGTWSAQLRIGKRVLARRRTTELVVPTGTTVSLAMKVPKKVVARIGKKAKLQLRLTFTTTEPFGARAVVKAALKVRKR